MKFIGEADTTWPRFLDDLASGQPIKPRYQQETPTDMATLPCPRYDLLALGARHWHCLRVIAHSQSNWGV